MHLNMEMIIDFIDSNTLIGLKAGKIRDNFSEIWMVTYNNRIFARSWGLTERSWYNTFLVDFIGEIKCDDKVYKIRADIPKDLSMINELLNQAYLDKYDFGENSAYAQEMIKPKHYLKTMEFVVI